MKWYLNYKHSQELLIHLLAWVFLFCLPPMLIGRANERPGQEEMFRMMGPPLAMAMVFYLNYIWLVPQLLFNKRNKAYVLSPMWRSASVCCSSPICGLSWSMPIFTVLPLLPKTVWDSGASCCFVCAISFCSD